MIFEAKRGQQANPDPALTIYGERLGRVDRYNYLGIVLDESLTFKSHIDKTISSCNHLLFSLAKIRWFINSSIAVQVYKSLILSRLTYGVLLCLGASQLNRSRLQKVQNRGLRICFCADRYTSNLKLHNDAKVLPLSLRMKLDTY